MAGACGPLRHTYMLELFTAHLFLFNTIHRKLVKQLGSIKMFKVPNFLARRDHSVFIKMKSNENKKSVIKAVDNVQGSACWQ